MTHLENSITDNYTLSHAKQTLESLSQNLTKCFSDKTFIGKELDTAMNFKIELDTTIQSIRKAEDILKIA